MSYPYLLRGVYWLLLDQFDVESRGQDEDQHRGSGSAWRKEQIIILVTQASWSHAVKTWNYTETNQRSKRCPWWWGQRWPGGWCHPAAPWWWWCGGSSWSLCWGTGGGRPRYESVQESKGSTFRTNYVCWHALRVKCTWWILTGKSTTGTVSVTATSTATRTTSRRTSFL